MSKGPCPEPRSHALTRLVSPYACGRGASGLQAAPLRVVKLALPS